MASYEISVRPDRAGIPPVLDWIEACCAGEGLPNAVTRRFELALEEAVINVIDHALAECPAPHLVRLRLDIGRQRIAAEVIDNGEAFDPSRNPAPDCGLPVDRRDPGGLGIHLMRNMVDRIEYRREAGCNHLRLETTLPAAA